MQRLVSDNPLVEVKSCIQAIFSSGGPLDTEANIALKAQLDTQITEVYGSTETGGIGWRRRTLATDENWKAFQGVSVSYQPDTDLLELTSPYLTQEKFQADDRVKLINANTFKLLGRADRIVKIEEKRVSLDDVQTRLKQHEYVTQAHVIVIGTTRKRLAALVVLNEAGLEAKSKCRKYQLDRLFSAFLSDWFEATVLPKKYRYPPELPYNARGKLNKRELESFFD